VTSPGDPTAGQIASARQILGAAEEESLGDAVKRVVKALAWADDTARHKATLDETRRIIGAMDGQGLSARASDVMAELRLLREHAEAEPPQVFRIIPRVTIDRTAVRFEVVTTDPGIRALTADQLARLGLVVCDE